MYSAWSSGGHSLLCSLTQPRKKKINEEALLPISRRDFTTEHFVVLSPLGELQRLHYKKHAFMEHRTKVLSIEHLKRPK